MKLKCLFVKEVEDWKEVLELEFVVFLEGSFGLEELLVIEVSLFLIYLDVWGMIIERIYRICVKNWFLNVYYKFFM